MEEAVATRVPQAGRPCCLYCFMNHSEYNDFEVEKLIA